MYEGRLRLSGRPKHVWRYSLFMHTAPGLKTNFNLSASHFSYKSINHRSLLYYNSVKTFRLKMKTTQFLTPREKPMPSIRTTDMSLMNYYDAQDELLWCTRWTIMMYKNTCFGASSHFVGSRQGNLHQSSATMSEMTCFILQAHTGTCISHS